MVRTDVAPIRTRGGFTVRLARREDLPGARQVIYDVLEHDLGGYKPQMHWDLDKLAETYLEQPRYALFVAVDDEAGKVFGTTAVRPGGPKSPPHPKWLADKYDPVKTAQLFRVYLQRDNRRRGAARELVEAARQWIADEGTYEVIYLHTNPASPGAEKFWRAMDTIETYDARKDANAVQALHFEMPFPTKSEQDKTS